MHLLVNTSVFSETVGGTIKAVYITTYEKISGRVGNGDKAPRILNSSTERDQLSVSPSGHFTPGTESPVHIG